MFVCFFFFCFKQKTAYEMRISDWSSDVCSSDLQLPHGGEMIRMGVGVDDEPHPQAAAVGQADITVGLSQRWIDDGRDAALFASYEIGLAALAVRDLLKEHAPPPPGQSIGCGTTRR